MTENKRFDMIITSADGSFHYLDKNTGEKITSTLELENKLNELNNENEQLKHDATVLIQSNKDYRKENEELKQFKEKVFVLLDEKIKHYGHKPFSAPVGQPMSVNFDADVDRLARLSELQDLEKELKK